MRGEYPGHPPISCARSELPPRARRIPCCARSIVHVTGTTSACAENTIVRTLVSAAARNYLRVRGEYRVCQISMGSSRELPPRARRIHLYHITILSHDGTTSACAENTFTRLTRRLSLRNYLRVRGEYIEGFHCVLLKWELPPRARRIP